MAFIEADEDDFEQILHSSFETNPVVILKFGSEYCEPCHALECELEEIDEEREDVAVISIDTDESPSLAEQFEVYQLPTMIIYRDKKIIHHKEGVMLAQDIEEIIGG